MFDSVDEAGLVTTIEEATRAEAAAGALRCAAVGELTARRLREAADDAREWWLCDPWDSTAAEIAAAMSISHRKASGQMRIAETLRDHLPAVAALFREGQLSSRVVAAITWRTRLITEEEVWARIDAAVAERALKWGPLSDDRLDDAVDALVQRFDPEAVIIARQNARTRDFVVGGYEDEAGTTSVWARLLAHDAQVWKKRVAAMVVGVCDNDPRTAAERRADAFAAIGNGNDVLPCACRSPQCPAAGNPAPKSSVVINVIADQTAIDAAKDLNAAQHAPAAQSSAAQSPSEARRDSGTALLPDNTPLPTPMLAELLRQGATLRPLRLPASEPEPRYRPSARLAAFVRARDVTCRFPGCTVPAVLCDIDHVIPYPLGVTHAANLVCLCRRHHLLKTFWVGDWALLLLCDGTVVWTAPTGRTYTTHPGCRSFFPDWDTTATDLRNAAR